MTGEATGHDRSEIHLATPAPETADPGAPTVILTGHPEFGYIRIKQRRRR